VSKNHVVQSPIANHTGIMKRDRIRLGSLITMGECDFNGVKSRLKVLG